MDAEILSNSNYRGFFVDTTNSMQTDIFSQIACLGAFDEVIRRQIPVPVFSKWKLNLENYFSCAFCLQIALYLNFYCNFKSSKKTKNDVQDEKLKFYSKLINFTFV